MIQQQLLLHRSLRLVFSCSATENWKSLETLGVRLEIQRLTPCPSIKTKQFSIER